ncbi:MAG: phosphatidate cytidylyltransferase [Clostridia bacterium]|nr:phosphatidate cytidylyltransferase [Clostridia bacterium]
MLTRILTGIVGVAVFIGILLLPRYVFSVALAAVIFMMLYECYSATKADTGMRIAGFISAILIMCMYYTTLKSVQFYAVMTVPIIVILLYMALVVIKHGKRDYKDVLSSGFLTVYVTVSTGCIWLLKESFGIPAMLVIFISAWGSDTLAYFTGRALGKHKLIPHVSPKKTVEGAIGGVIGAAVLVAIYFMVLDKCFNITLIQNYILKGALIGAVGGALSQLGDLCASAIKRDGDIKDFGWIFPGHGGFMDRFDSVIYISPIIFIGIFLLSMM